MVEHKSAMAGKGLIPMSANFSVVIYLVCSQTASVLGMCWNFKAAPHSFPLLCNCIKLYVLGHTLNIYKSDRDLIIQSRKSEF